MRSKLVRLALLAFPRRWRRRYGAELQDFTTEVLAGQQTLAGRALTITDLVGQGIGERLRSTEPLPVKTAITSTAAVVAAAIAMAGGIASDSMTPIVRLAPNAHIDPGVSVEMGVVNSQSLRDHGPIAIHIPKGPYPKGDVQVVGRPSNTVINPKTMQIYSVTPLNQPRRHSR